MTPERLASFAKTISEKRKQFGTRSAFCEHVGITRTTLRALERATQEPSPGTLDKLIDKLGLTAEELIGGPRLKPDHPLMKDLTEEDLRIAQMFHHAGVQVKQQTIGLLQARQPPHDPTRGAITADVTDYARQLLALGEGPRFTVTQLIAELADLMKAARPPDVPAPAAPPPTPIVRHRAAKAASRKPAR